MKYLKLTHVNAEVQLILTNGYDPEKRMIIKQ